MPDVTFGAPPGMHILHVVAFIVCSLTSIGAMLWVLQQLPESTSWWPVLSPQLAFPLISVAFHSYCILPASQTRAIRMQIGEEPNPSTTVRCNLSGD